MRSALRVTLLAPLVALASCATSSNQLATSGFVGEVQAYPAGVIPGVRHEWHADDASVNFVRVAANLTDRQDFGEHDDETGEGFGLGVGQRHWVEPSGADRGSLTGLHWGWRADVWSMEIDWEDRAPMRTGTTDILVLQPSLEGGYSWNTDAGRVDLTLGLGVEINVDTDGEDVGEGAILLLGISLAP